MGMVGKKTGGRTKGTPNRINSSVAEMLAARNCNPFEVLADIAMGNLECNRCRGKGKTKFQPGNSENPGIRECQSCWSSGKEHITPAEKARASEVLSKYLKPQLQAMQVSGPEGEPIAIRVIFGKE